MTDKFEELISSAEHFVDVRAQVMVRDDSAGGWVPFGPGGLSKVTVGKCAVPNEDGEIENEYIIYGKRIKDEEVVLSCIIKKDLEYNKVMPTFHHWMTGEKKYGLTFQTAADARAFDKGLRAAVNELLDSVPDGDLLREKFCDEPEEEKMLKALQLPIEGGDGFPSPDSSARDGPQTASQDQAAPPPHFYITSILSPGNESPTYSDINCNLELASLDAEVAGLAHGRSIEAGFRNLETVAGAEPDLPRRGTRRAVRLKCEYCQEFFLEGENPRGACEYAPDWAQTAVNRVACIRCAQCLLYHAISDEEGKFAEHPCQCEEGNHCNRKWVILGFLSIFVPCLWLYPPLHACHWSCVRCGWCGGRHRPAS